MLGLLPMLLPAAARRAFTGAVPVRKSTAEKRQERASGVLNRKAESKAARGATRKTAAQGEGLYKGASRSDLARGRAAQRGVLNRSAQASRRAKPQAEEGLYSGESRADKARGRAAEKAGKDAENQAARRAKPDAEEGLYSGESRADKARGRATEKARKDAENQAARRAKPSDDEEHLYSGQSRADKARGRAEQRRQDGETARHLNVSAKDVREERAWQQNRSEVKTEAAVSALRETASLTVLPGGVAAQSALVAARVAAADAGYQLRTPRPFLISRQPAAARVKMEAAFARLEDSLTLLSA